MVTVMVGSGGEKGEDGGGERKDGRGEGEKGKDGGGKGRMDGGEGEKGKD